jgi:hypothetical protein
LELFFLYDTEKAKDISLNPYNMHIYKKGNTPIIRKFGIIVYINSEVITKTVVKTQQIKEITHKNRKRIIKPSVNFNCKANYIEMKKTIVPGMLPLSLPRNRPPRARAQQGAFGWMPRENSESKRICLFLTEDWKK